MGFMGEEATNTCLQIVHKRLKMIGPEETWNQPGEENLGTESCPDVFFFDQVMGGQGWLQVDHISSFMNVEKSSF